MQECQELSQKKPKPIYARLSIVRHNPKKGYKYRVLVTFFRRDHPKFLIKIMGGGGDKAF
ncbi:hypothetical protein B1F79_05305 [Coxiella-like endosymbiont of Rhipicephalus sanguineus]|nr:hypothetical protein [Coxiella-like endosymbiont of Rhipicephalus sanguineus]